MNIETMIPLLMKNADPKLGAILSAINGDKSKLFDAAFGENKNKELFKLLASQRRSERGLYAIRNIAPKDILGIMLKYYS